MIWSYFIIFAVVSVVLWAIGAWAAWRNRRILAFGATGLGLVIFFSYILIMWITLERPPLRTMGETRLWYSFFLPLAGIIVFSRWQYKWILSFSTLLATVFVCVNIFKPEIHSKTLMPALQSPWFAPHVIVYMMAYALLGAAVVMSVYLLFFKKGTDTDKEMEITDNLAYVGLSFMTLGMLMGALWAKEAWGHYWSWDPKETWALITFMIYAIPLHSYSLPQFRKPDKYHLFMFLAFLSILMTYFGVNYILGGMHSYA